MKCQYIANEKYVREKTSHALYLYMTCMLHLVDYANFLNKSLFHCMLKLSREKAVKKHI